MSVGDHSDVHIELLTEEVAALKDKLAELQRERIISAAINYGDIVCTIGQGGTHANVMLAFFRAARDTKDVDANRAGTDGFITSTGRFVTREEAAEIAKTAGQVKENTSSLNSYQIKW